MRQYLNLFAHDHARNLRILEYLESKDKPNEEIVKLFNHVISAKNLWYQRVMRKPVTSIVWPDWGLEVLREKTEENHREWEDFIKQLDESMLNLSLHYKNSRGTEFRRSIGTILDHLLMHGAHHRGQVAMLIRNEGGEPPAMDYIHYFEE